MKRNAKISTSLPVLPDCFCWSTWIASWPARCACMPGGGDESLITPRRSLIRVVCAPWLFWLTLDST